MENILETERLVLRSIVPGDEEVLHSLVFSDADVMRFVLTDVPFNSDETHRFIKEQFNHSGTGVGLGVALYVLAERSLDSLV